MTAKIYALAVEGFSIQLLHAYVKYNEGFGDGGLWQAWTTSK